MAIVQQIRNNISIVNLRKNTFSALILSTVYLLVRFQFDTHHPADKKSRVCEHVLLNFSSPKKNK